MSAADLPIHDTPATVAGTSTLAAPVRPTLFSQLRALALAVGPLGIILTADEKSDTMTMIVSPRPDDEKKEKVLCSPLSLTGTPDDFDANFVSALMDYTPQIASFSQQIAENYARVERAGALAVANASKPSGTHLPKPGVKPAAPKPSANLGSSSPARAEGNTALGPIAPPAAEADTEAPHPEGEASHAPTAGAAAQGTLFDMAE